MSTLQVRPTFSESWYRVAGLKAKLRASAQISRQHYRGERWYVVRDPAGNQFHRLSDAAFRFVGLLDGTRTVQEAWDLVGGQLADEAPTQPEVIHILSQLHSANLLEADITPDSAILLRRHKEQQKQKMQQRLMNVLFPRIPLWDPDRFLKRWLPLGRVILSKPAIFIWLAVVTAAIIAITGYSGAWHRLSMAAMHSIDLKNNIENLFYLYLMFVLIKLIHELGHAFMCRRFGGEVHELGIMFLVLIPAPYVDASTAWAFRSKWQRVLVGAAGMISELFVAALAAFIWNWTADTSVINQLAYNCMLIAGVSTILFNANPLLRYDGYYILADLLEIPNFRQKSVEYSLGLIKQHIFRVKLPNPLPPMRQRFWLLLYAITSSIYRVFIGIVIILFVTWKVPILGVLMGLGGIITWAVVPVWKTFKYLALEPELHRKRGRAVLFVAAVTAVVILTVGVLRFNVHVDVEGIVEPSRKAILHAGVGGFVHRIAVKDGQAVHKGQILLVLENRELLSQIEQMEANRKSIEADLRRASVEDQSAKRIAEIRLKAANDQLAELRGRKDRLTIRAPFDGRVIAPVLDQMDDGDVYIHQGEKILVVADWSHLTVKAAVEQENAMIQAIQKATAPPQVRLSSAIAEVLVGSNPMVVPAATKELVSPILGSRGSGSIPADPTDPSGTKSAAKQFELHLNIDNPGHRYLPGQRAYIRFTLGKRPLLWQWGRDFLQLVMQQDDRWF